MDAFWQKISNFSKTHANEPVLAVNTAEAYSPMRKRGVKIRLEIEP